MLKVKFRTRHRWALAEMFAAGSRTFCRHPTCGVPFRYKELMRMLNGSNRQPYGKRSGNPFSWFLDHFSIPNLSLIIILCYGFGYILQAVNSSFLDYLTLNPYLIFRGQVWRLITWVLVPPGTSNIFFILIAMMFYYSIGTSLENAWGTREYNAYIWTGIGLTIVGAFVSGAILLAVASGYDGMTADILRMNYQMLARYFSTYYVSTSIFLAYAMTFPDATVLLWFIIPVKVKWMGVVYGVLLLIDFVNAARGGGLSGLFICISMIASLANFLIFWLRRKDLRRFSPKEIKRRADFRNAVNRGQKAASQGGFSQGASRMRPAGAGDYNGQTGRPAGYTVARHRCAICGKTELDDPTAEFRYCSKCQGGYEFCQDHLFSHQHSVNGSGPLPAERVVNVEPDGRE